MNRIPWIAAALVALAACAPKPETPEQAQARLKAVSDSAKAAIEAAEARLAAYVRAGQVDSASLGYAEDASFFMAGSPPSHGRAAVLATFRQLLTLGTWTLRPTAETVEASGPIAVEMGHYVFELAPAPHAPATVTAMFPDSGDYVTTWRKVGGRWLIVNDISVSTRAPAAEKKR